MKLCPPLAINTKSSKARFLECALFVLWHCKKHCYWAISGLSISPLYLFCSIKYSGFWDFSFSAKSFPFCVVIPSLTEASHILVVNGEEFRPSLKAMGTGAYTSRKGQSPTKAEHGSNAYTAPRYRKSSCSNPAWVGFEPWFICGTVFLFLTHHYVRLLAWMMYLMSSF